MAGVAALKVAATLLGPGMAKLIALPAFLAAVAYFNYDLYDPENQPVNQRPLLPEYDFIIVGGGSAGSVLANRLSEIADWKILLLEAGGFETEISDVPILSLYLHNSRMDWRYRTQPQRTACNAMNNNQCHWTRGKVLGGSSVLNTMLYIRGNRRDYDHWSALGNQGWSYDDVLPYFLKSEDQRNPYLARTPYHRAGGYQTVQDSPWNSPLGIAFIQAGVEMGYDHLDVNGEQQTGFAPFQFTMRRGYRCSASKSFLNPIRLRRNLHIAVWSHATRLLIDPPTKRAYGVEFQRDGRLQQVRARKEVILSAGAINSPQLLMLSGIGEDTHLRSKGIPVLQNLPGVGRNLMDHIAIGGLVFLINESISLVQERMVNLATGIRYAVLGDGPLTSNIGLEAVGFISTKFTNQSDDWPDIEFMITSASTPSDSQVRRAHNLKESFYNELFGNVTNRDVFGVFPMILRPKSRGFIRLESKSPFRYPLLYHNYMTHPDDVKVLREGIKASIAFGQTKSMKRFGARFYDRPVPGCQHLKVYTDEYWECVARQYTMTIYHMSGTCKMAPSTDPMAVVNPRLKVYGINRLRVIDASIMPQITSGNINAPTLMIGEKGADIIKEDWNRK